MSSRLFEAKTATFANSIRIGEYLIEPQVQKKVEWGLQDHHNY